MREDARTRGRRLLAEGRLDVIALDPREIRATVKGDSGQRHELGYSRGRWYCSCPARTQCSHLYALQLVAPRPWRPANDLLDGHGREPVAAWERTTPPVPYRRDP
jgi:hypothetical protein